MRKYLRKTYASCGGEIAPVIVTFSPNGRDPGVTINEIELFENGLDGALMLVCGTSSLTSKATGSPAPGASSVVSKVNAKSTQMDSRGC